MAIVILAGSKFKHSRSTLSNSAVEAEVSEAFSVARQLRKKIVDAVPLGSDAVCQAIHDFLASFETRLACTIEAAKKRPAWDRPNVEKLLDIPLLLKVSKPLPEKATVHAKIKKTGSIRPLVEFGPVYRAGQQMVLRAVEPIFKPQPWQHQYQGLPHAISLAKAGLLVGKVHRATLDIRDHFGSFKTKKLTAELPMNKTWVENVVGGRHTQMKIGVVPPYCTLPFSSLCILAQRGLLQGSICSPIIAARSVSFLPWIVSPSLLLSNYADNFLLLAETKAQLDKAICELSDAVKKLPGGKFDLVLQGQGHASSEFEFLGHLIQLVNEKVRIRPGVTTYEVMCQKGIQMDADISEHMSNGAKQKAIDSAKAYLIKVKGWLAAFAACDDIAEYETSFLILVQQALPSGFSVCELMKSVQADYEYSSDEYQYV